MQVPAAPPAPTPAAGGTSALIPYRNAPALAAYYCAVFSLIPFFGLPLALAAVVLGFMGRARVAREPGVHGTAHAWVGLVLGSLVLLAYLALGVFLLSVFLRKGGP